MKQIHIECKPDRCLVSKLGFTRKQIIHHQGKYKVFDRLQKVNSELAMVDEDPESDKSKYEQLLEFKEENSGIKLYTDSNKNMICVLSIKLEDWLLLACRQSQIKPSSYGLPDNQRELKQVILNKLGQVESLVDELVRQENPSILQLKKWLQ